MTASDSSSQDHKPADGAVILPTSNDRQQAATNPVPFEPADKIDDSRAWLGIRLHVIVGRSLTMISISPNILAQGRLIPLFRLRHMPIAWDGLEHTHAVALGVDE